MPLLGSDVPRDGWDWSSAVLGIGGGFVTTITGLLAAALWIGHLRGHLPLVEHAIRRARNKTIKRELRRLGIGARVCRRAIRKAARLAVSAGRDASIQEEVEWLGRLAKSNDAGWHGPVVLTGLRNGASAGEDMQKLSVAYAELSRRLRGFAFLSTNSILEEQAELARRTSQYLQEHSGFRDEGSIDNPSIELSRPFGEWLELRFHFIQRSLTSLTRIDEVDVAHTRTRQVLAGTEAAEWSKADPVEIRELDTTQSERKRLGEALQRPRMYDGVLPALEGAWIQRDVASGHRRLLLHLSEMMFSVVSLRFHVSESEDAKSRTEEDPGSQTPLLTLSLLPLTADRHIVIAERAVGTGNGAGRLTTGVGGNLELRSRRGLSVDADEDGMPNVLAALCREAHEELGLDVASRHIEVLGLTRIRYDEEVNTRVLLTSSRLSLSRKQFLRAARGADASEGYWEFSGRFLFVPEPDSPEKAKELVRSALRTARTTPHLVASVIALCAPWLVEAQDSLRDLEAALAELVLEAATDGPTLEDLGHWRHR